MLSPELIADMLFLPAMADNEAIEIVGVERFSSYTGLVLLNGSKLEYEIKLLMPNTRLKYFKNVMGVFFSPISI